MKNRILSIVLVVVLLAATVLTVSAQDLEPITLTIIGTNDIHANYAETPDRVDEGQVATTGKIGYAKISAYKKALEENGPVLLLDGGDTTHGQVFATLMQGESIIMLMNEAGYDAMVPGNHDFNYGYEQLRELEYPARQIVQRRRTRRKNHLNHQKLHLPRPSRARPGHLCYRVGSRRQIYRLFGKQHYDTTESDT